jgi:PAS domain S-box-containing protein
MASAADSPSTVPESVAPRVGGSLRQSLRRRTLAFQAGFGLLSITALLVGLAWVLRGDPPSASHPVVPALAASVAILAVGLFVSYRCLSPVRDVEQQLHRVASSSLAVPNNVEPVPGSTTLDAGWNRIVQLLRSAEQPRSLQDRLEEAVGEYRNRKGERVLNALTDGIAVTDDAQRIKSANSAFCSIMNLSPDMGNVTGRTVVEVLARRAGEDQVKEVVEAGDRGHRIVVEISCPGDDSSAVLRVCRTPLANDGGTNRGGYVWSVRDVTQQKMADKMRDQFVNAATHELRTPMANIKAYAEMLALGEVDDVEQQKMFCNVINDEVTRLARFIDDLLHLSRMEVGATTLQLQVTDMTRLLEEAAKKIQPLIGQKNQTFETELPGKLPELIVDKDKLAVAVLNLLGNAAKYTPEGGSVRLHVALLPNAIQIDVEDTGIGIAEEELPKVLDKFYRSSDPRVHGETGSGLGLSITQEIVRLHGGTLSVSSEVNKGSKFTIILPTTAE